VTKIYISYLITSKISLPSLGYFDKVHFKDQIFTHMKIISPNYFVVKNLP